MKKFKKFVKQIPIVFASVGRKQGLDDVNEAFNDWYERGTPVGLIKDAGTEKVYHHEGQLLLHGAHPQNHKDSVNILQAYYVDKEEHYNSLTKHYLGFNPNPVPIGSPRHAALQSNFMDDHPNIAKYSGSYSAPWNQALIRAHMQKGKDYPSLDHTPLHKMPEDAQKHIMAKNSSEHVDDIFTHDKELDKLAKPAPHDFHVFTGVGSGFNIGEIRKTSDTVHLPAYTSTSISPRVASNFAYRKYKSHDEMIRIHIPKGSKHGTFIGSFGALADEGEFLLKRGRTLKFHGEPRYNNGTMIHDATLHEDDEESK